MDSVEKRVSCEECLSRLDGGETPETAPDLSEHVSLCAECRAEYRIRTLCAALNEEPPAELPASVMSLIRAERVRQISRRKWMRRMGGVAAALLIVPALAVFAPLFLNRGLSAPESAYEAGGAVAGADQAAADTAQTTQVPGMMNSVFSATSDRAETAGVAETTAEPGPAPSHVLKSDNAPAQTTGPTLSAVTETEEQKKMFGVSAAAPEPLEDRLLRILAVILGEAQGDPRELIRQNRISGEALRKAAEQAEIPLSEAEIEELVG